jgi:hypothetical protein
MTKPERFSDMAAVRRERERLRVLRNERLEALNGHWRNLEDKDLRRTFFLSMVRNALRSAFSRSGAKDLLSGISPEMVGGLAAMVLGGRARTVAGKAMAMGLSAAVPFLSGKLRNAGNGRLMSELDTSLERVKAYIRERREARRARRSDEGQ